MVIGVISDTHIPRRKLALPPQLFSALKGVDLIIHAGDITDDTVITQLQAIAPVQAVYGNSDGWALRQSLPKTLRLRLGKYQIGVVHGDRMTPLNDKLISLFPEADCIIYGHTHTPCSTMIGGVLLFNPGSPTDKRGNPYYTYGIIRINGSLQGEIVNF